MFGFLALHSQNMHACTLGHMYIEISKAMFCQVCIDVMMELFSCHFMSQIPDFAPCEGQI